MSTYHHEKGAHFAAGDVLRPRSLGQEALPGIARPATYLPPFSDVVVLGFNGEGDMLLARPYVYATGVGTTGPHALMWAEQYSARENPAHWIRTGIERVA